MFKDDFMKLNPLERAAVCAVANISLPYVQKHMYTSGGAPKFRFHNAVELDKASGGALSFVEHTTGCVDWDYVRETLNRAQKLGVSL